MSCIIPYLDDKYQGTQLSNLRKKHIGLVKKVISSKLFYRKNGHLQLSRDLTSDVRKEQEAFVATIPELSIVTSNNSVKEVKSGVDFVFEQNPELANAIYDSLGINLKLENIVYSAVFFNTDEVVKKYAQVHPNLYSHHSTIEFKPSDVSNLSIGENKEIKIIGRLTTDKVDVLIVDNPLSKNKYAHITLSTAEGIKPFESNKEIENNKDKIKPINDTLNGTIGVFDGKNEITSIVSEEQKQEAKEQYSDYISNVFPDSKIKDIVYRGTPENYPLVIGNSASLGKGMTFTNNRKWALDYTTDGTQPTLHTALININNPLILTDNIDDLSDEIVNNYIKDKNKELNDGTIVSTPISNNKEFLVVDRNQIHILGNKQDIEQFKQWKNKNVVDILSLKVDEEKIESVPDDSVNYTLKSIDVLSSDKGKQVFEKGKKAGWDLNKILNELQIPKEQKQLVLDLNINDREKIILELAFLYNFSVKINITKTNRKDDNNYSDPDNYDYYMENRPNERGENLDEEQNTTYYQNLSIPGGTNYTENEISTPLITPNIKGHAEFSTDNGIGWFRSDEQGKSNSKKPMFKVILDGISQNEFFTNKEAQDFIVLHASKRGGDTSKYSIEEVKSEIFNENTKTRRILETQSDLFQKGREEEELTGSKVSKEEREPASFSEYKNAEENGKKIQTQFMYEDSEYKYENYIYWAASERDEEDGSYYTNYYKKLDNTYYINNNKQQNQFLQLLNKDNNWVTFFLKSIIQDSAKKGYEKVLFPSGNTASKVEGHTTLEGFKKEKEDRIKSLETPSKNEVKNYSDLDEKSQYFITEEEWLKNKNKKLEEKQTEINQLRQELERVKKEGFGALKPIFNFYENTITNILINNIYGKESKFVNYEFTFNNDKYETLNDKNQYLKNGVEISQKEFNTIQNSITKQDKKDGNFTEKYYVNSNAFITDDYGNTWNEIVINQERDRGDILFQVKKSNLNTVYEKTNRNLIINKFHNDTTLLKGLNIAKHFAGFPKKMIEYFEFVVSKKEYKTVKDLIYGVYNDFFKNDYYAINNLPVNKKLEDKLKLFLEKFNITISEKTQEQLKKKYGFNILGVFDIINKNIEVVAENRRNVSTLPEEISHAIIEIMGSSYKHSERFKELSVLVQSWEGYSTIYREYSKIYTDSLGKPDWKKIKKEAIGKALTMAFLELENPDFFKKSPEEMSLLSKIKSLFMKIIDFISQDIRKSYENKEFKSLINEIATNVLNENYDFFSVQNDAGFNTLLYEDTIEKQNETDGGKALNVMQTISKFKGNITGSLAIRKVGVLKRKAADNLHDIDVIFRSTDFNKNIKDIFNISLDDIESSDLVKSLKAQYGNQFQLFSNWSNRNENYAAIHFYITEDPAVTDIFKKKEGMLSVLYEKLTDEQKNKTIIIDIFLDDKYDFKPVKDDVYGLNLTPAYLSFVPKIFNMGRKKDIYDYQSLKYYNDENKIDVPDIRNYLFQNDFESFEENPEDEPFNIPPSVDEETAKENTEFSKYLSNEENEKTFVSMINGIKIKFNDYIGLLQESMVEYPSSEKEVKYAELNALRKILNNETTQDAIIGLNNYITQSVQWIDSISNEYFNNSKNVLADVKALEALPEGDVKQKEVQRLTKILNKTKHFLSLFNDLDEFKTELNRSGFLPDDKYNTKFFNDRALFEKEMTAIGAKDIVGITYDAIVRGNFSTESIKDLIFYNQFKDRLSTLTDTEGQLFRKAVSDMFKRNVNKTFTSQMSEALGKADRLKKEINNLHYTLATDWLFPLYDQQQANLAADSPMRVSKSKFKALLKLSDKDENVIVSWIEATIQSKDPLVAVVAKKIADGLREVDLENYKLSVDITNARAASGFDDMTPEQRKKEYDEMNNMITQLVTDDYGNAVEITADDIREGIEINTLQGVKRYLTVQTKAWKTGEHTSLALAYKNLTNSLIFNKTKDADGNVIPSLLNQLLSSAFNEQNYLDADSLAKFIIDNQRNIPELWEMRYKLFTTMEGGLTKTNGKHTFNKNLLVELNEAKDRKALLKKILGNQLKNVLFYNKTYNKKTTAQLTTLFTEEGIDKDNVNSFNKYITDNTAEEKRLFIVKNLSKKENGFDDYVTIESEGKTLLLYRTKSVELADGTIIKGDLKFDEYKDIDQDDIENVFYKTNEFQELKPEFKLPVYDGAHESYFKFLYKEYQRQNQKLGNLRNKHGIVSQQKKSGKGLSEIKSVGGLFQDVLNWIENTYTYIIDAWNKRFNTPDQNDEKEKTSFEAEYLNGTKVQKVGMAFTTRLENQDDVETDLAFSLLSFNMMVNQNLKLKSFDAQVQVVKTIVIGDALLGMSPRLTKKQDAFGNFFRKRRGGKYDEEDNFKKTVSTNLNAKLIEFIDEMMYDENDYAAFGLGNVSTKEIAGVIGGYTTFTNLALNLTGMLSNVINGKVSTYLESIQGNYFDRDTWLASERVYVKAMADHYNDFITSNMKDKSLIGQLTIILDAIQGEYSEGKSVAQLRKKKLSDVPGTCLYFTQNGAEHYIQTVNMIAMLKAESSPTHENLWEEFYANFTSNNNLVSVEKQELQNRILQFQGRLHSVNKRLNGAYAKIDKSRLQRRWIGRLALMFRKYIWQFAKARFDGEQLDIDSGDVTRGYVSAYYSDLVKDLKANKNFFYRASRIVKQVVEDNKRIALGTVNALTFGALNKGIDKNKWYGFNNMQAREIGEARRLITEMSLFAGFTLLGAVLGAIGDDDDEEKKGWTLSELELLAKRQRGDLGVFLPTMINLPTGNLVPGLGTVNFIAKTVASPIPSMRAYTNLIATFSQLTDVEYKEGGINFTANDEYNQKGVGYEKGDLKIVRKLEKSVIAPLWQTIKFLNPEEQLKVVEMLNKNAQ